MDLNYIIISSYYEWSYENDTNEFSFNDYQKLWNTILSFFYLNHY